MIRRRWSVAAIALVCALGCEQKRKSPPSRPAARPSFDAAVDPPHIDREHPAPSADPPQISLVDPGRAPLTPIRFHHKVGVRDRVAVTLRIAAKHQVQGAATPALKMPAFRLVIDIEVLELFDDHAARYRFEVSKAEITNDNGVDALVLSTTRADLAKTVGMSGTGLVDRRGLRRDTELELPADASDQWKQMLAAIKTSLDYLSSPFPHEAIGVGARWEHYQTLTQNGMQVRQTTVFELTELSKQQGKLRATIKQSADRQTAYLPGLPMGVEAELVALSSTGSSEIHFDLSHEAPLRASIDLQTDSSFSIKTGGAQQSLELQADVGMVIESETR